MRSSRCDGTEDPARPQNNIGEGVGRILTSQTRGGLYEHFFEAVGKAVEGEARPLVFKDQPDVGRIVEAAAEHGIEIPVPIA